jgi:hypothetical protein
VHHILPFEKWRNLYQAQEDPQSPFYGNEYNNAVASHTLYNYYIHPYWDAFGSPTLYCKILFVNYDKAYAIIEMFGEWNDCLNNDIMYFRREVTDLLQDAGIQFFILLGEHVLDFHGSDETYYEDWLDNLDEGWIKLVNFRKHVLQEMKRSRITNFLLFNGNFDEAYPWRTLSPDELFQSPLTLEE